MRRSVFILLATLCLTLICQAVFAEALPGGEKPWRIRFLDAAIVEGEDVLLGEVAVPVGDMPPELWQKLASRRLWPAPPVNGKPLNMTRPRLQEAVVHYMNDLAPYSLFPGSMIVQRGGVAVSKAEIHEMIVKGLTPLLGGLPGESGLSDIRMPNHIFLANKSQQLMLEQPKRIQPGRLSLKLVVREMDGRVVQKLTGSAFVDCWVEVPCAAMPLNRDDELTPDRITFVRTNLAKLRSEVWDGRGGPWRVLRPIGVNQVIYQTAIATIPTVQRGNTVNLVYEGGAVFLSVNAQAMEDGVAGQSIQVRNLQSKKQVFAIVRDAGTVVIRGREQANDFQKTTGPTAGMEAGRNMETPS